MNANTGPALLLFLTTGGGMGADMGWAVAGWRELPQPGQNLSSLVSCLPQE